MDITQTQLLARQFIWSRHQRRTIALSWPTESAAFKNNVQAPLGLVHHCIRTGAELRDPKRKEKSEEQEQGESEIELPFPPSKPNHPAVLREGSVAPLKRGRHSICENLRKMSSVYHRNSHHRSQTPRSPRSSRRSSNNRRVSEHVGFFPSCESGRFSIACIHTPQRLRIKEMDEHGVPFMHHDWTRSPYLRRRLSLVVGV